MSLTQHSQMKLMMFEENNIQMCRLSGVRVFRCTVKQVGSTKILNLLCFPKQKMKLSKF